MWQVYSHLRRWFHTKCNKSVLLLNMQSGVVAFLIPIGMDKDAMSRGLHDVKWFELLVLLKQIV